MSLCRPLEERARESLTIQIHRIAASMHADRTGWTREQWIDEARELMADPDAGVMCLVAGHAQAMLAELDERGSRA